MSELDRMLKTIADARAASEKRTRNSNSDASTDPLHDVADNTVTKSHALSRAYYRLGIVEKRCMEGLISKLHPLRGDNHQIIELSAIEYCKAYGVSNKVAYRDISSAVDALMHRVITTDRKELNKKGKSTFTLMSSAEYMDDEGKIACEFNYHVVPHLVGMREKFSSYPLRKAVNFSSSYTWRFYEILVSWAQPKSKVGCRFMGWIDRQNIEELRDMLGVPASYRWDNFKVQVLDIVEHELREKADIFISFERVKTGRKITHLNIKFAENDQQQLPLEGGAGS